MLIKLYLFGHPPECTICDCSYRDLHINLFGFRTAAAGDDPDRHIRYEMHLLISATGTAGNQF